MIADPVLPSVGDEPVILEPIQDQTVVAPQTASFTCRLQPGEPRAEVTWYMGSTVLPSSGDKYRQLYEGDAATLEVLNTEPQDAARYRIEACNKVGEVKSEATLTVHSEYLTLHCASWLLL